MTTPVCSIGINTYSGSGNSLAKCEADAKAFSALFSAKPTLLSRKATKPEIVRAVPEFVKMPGAGQWVVIHYSGHGSQVKDKSKDEPDGWDECIVTTELDAIIDDAFGGLFNGRRRNARVLVVTDSCFSGTMHRATPLLTASHMPRIREAGIRYLPHARMQPKGRTANVGPQAALSGVVHISGCADFEYSYEGAKGGVLTTALVEAYKPGLTIAKWFKAATTLIEGGEFAGMQHPQLNCTAAARQWRVPEV